MRANHEYSIRVVTNKLWENKTEFMFPCDRYETWTFFAVLEGSLSYTINGISGVATKDDLIICPPGLDFHRKVLSKSVTFVYCNFDWRSESSSELQYREFFTKSANYKISSVEVSHFCKKVNRLLILHPPSEIMYFKWMEHLINDLWLSIGMEKQNEVRTENMKPDRMMLDLMKKIESAAFDKIQLKDLAQQFNIGKVQLTRRFQRAFGMNPMEYVISLRLEKARKLLTETDYTIDHIAQLCGYDNGFYFSRVFSKFQHTTPSEYRRKYTL